MTWNYSIFISQNMLLRSHFCLQGLFNVIYHFFSEIKKYRCKTCSFNFLSYVLSLTLSAGVWHRQRGWGSERVSGWDGESFQSMKKYRNVLMFVCLFYPNMPCPWKDLLSDWIAGVSLNHLDLLIWLLADLLHLFERLTFLHLTTTKPTILIHQYTFIKASWEL